MSSPTVEACREAAISAESVLAEMEANADTDEIALVCQRQNLIGARFELVRARQDYRLRECAGAAPTTWDADWSCDAELAEPEVEALRPAEPVLPVVAEPIEPEAEADEAARPEPALRSAGDRILTKMREELRAPNERTPKLKRRDMRGERCRVHACTRRARPDGLCVAHGERDTCRLEGCEAPATGPGTSCYYHRGLGPEVTVAPVRRERREDGKCAHDECPRSARKAPRAFCQACETAGQFAGVCAADNCEAAIKVGGYCGRHRAFANAEIASTA